MKGDFECRVLDVVLELSLNTGFIVRSPLIKGARGIVVLVEKESIQMAEAYLIDKLNSVVQTFQELTRRLGDPDIASDPGEYKRVATTRSSLEETVTTYESWKKAQDDLVSAQEIYKDDRVVATRLYSPGSDAISGSPSRLVSS